MKIGIFGGTFNPPHKTHISMAQQSLKQLQLDKLIVVPCGQPPHKECDVDGKTRLTMCRLAFGDFAEISDFEILQQGKSYTVQTLRHFKEIYPSAKLYLIIGGDSLATFDKWYQPQEISKLCTLVVVERDGYDVTRSAAEVKERFGAETEIVRSVPTAVSSTEIRLRYEFGMDNSQYVSPKTNEYILSRGLYSEHRAMAEKLASYLKPERFMHTFYVVKRGLELCADEERDKVFVACLLHDCAKYIPKSAYASYNYSQPDDMPDSVVHSFLGAEVARKDFGINDREILDAIAYHTTGRPNMSRLEKIVYVADKTEDSRPYPLEHLKHGSLDEMFIACLLEAYEVCLERHCDSVCPLSEQTIEYYCGNAHNIK